VAYLNPTGVIGGAERSLLDLMAAIRGAAPEVSLHLIAAADGPLIGRASTLGVEVRVLPMTESLMAAGDSSAVASLPNTLVVGARMVRAGIAAWPYSRSLNHALAELGPDIVHSNGIKFHGLTGFLKRGVPVVWHIHDFVGSRPFAAHALRWAWRRAATGFAVSRAVAEDARASLGSERPIEVMHNGVDTVAFSPGRADGPKLDRLAGLAPEPGPVVRVGIVATYARWKGQDLFLEAAARALAAKAQVRLRIFVIGGPIYRTTGSQFTTDELRARASDLGIADRVGFVGVLEDVAEAYRALDIVVHASTRPEPFGLTIVEAMACARPVIVAQEGGAAELFTHDSDAFGVPPRDAEALARAILTLADDPARRARLGEHARQTVLERFTRERLGRQALATYRRLAASPPG
jgi:glycosyltransferase involved in cell wall biosynthesis